MICRRLDRDRTRARSRGSPDNLGGTFVAKLFVPLLRMEVTRDHSRDILRCSNEVVAVLVALLPKPQQQDRWAWVDPAAVLPFAASRTSPERSRNMEYYNSSAGQPVTYYLNAAAVQN